MLSEDPQETIMNEFMERWFEMRPPLNITWIASDAAGRLRDRTTLAYDGCIGSIQRNESDTAGVVAINNYYGPNVTTWNPLYSDTTMIGTMYTKKMFDKGYSTRVLDFIHSYSLIHWSFTAFLLVLISSVIFISLKILSGTKTRRSFSRSIDVIVGCTLNQHSNCNNISTSITTTFAYTLMTLLGFFTGYFLTSMIKTEMVALDPPFTIQSYQDILDHDVTPMWFAEASQHGGFEFGPPGSLEKRIWDRAVERGINKSIVSIHHILTENPATVVAYLEQLVSQKAVGLVRSIVTKLMASNLCSFSRQQDWLKNSNAYVHADPNAKEEMRMMPGSTLTNDLVRNRVKSGMTRKIEMGIFWNLMINREYMFYVQSPEGHVAEVEECIANVIVMPEYNLQSVPLFHYRDLILLATTLFVASLLILLTEKRLWKRRIHRIRCSRRKNLVPSLSMPHLVQSLPVIPEADET